MVQELTTLGLSHTPKFLAFLWVNFYLQPTAFVALVPSLSLLKPDAREVGPTRCEVKA